MSKLAHSFSLQLPSLDFEKTGIGRTIFEAKKEPSAQHSKPM